MSISNSYENSMADHVTGETTLSFVGQLYISLHTASPGETGVNEWTDSGYERKAIDFNTATTSGATNDGQIDFEAVVDGSISATHFVPLAAALLFWDFLFLQARVIRRELHQRFLMRVLQ